VPLPNVPGRPFGSAVKDGCVVMSSRSGVGEERRERAGRVAGIVGRVVEVAEDRDLGVSGRGQAVVDRRGPHGLAAASLVVLALDAEALALEVVDEHDQLVAAGRHDGELGQSRL
jgi:uncharacterized 2Fe-2S/4Fe-4S cluster protein (DUF4445 family)